MQTQSKTGPTDMLFQSKPDTAIPAAKRIASGLMESIEREALRRSGEHSDQWRAFWESPEATPQQIADEMGTQASLFFAIAAANIGHIDQIARLIGQTAADILPVEHLSAKRAVTFNQDGTVTIPAA
jgi:hypothetical protein